MYSNYYNNQNYGQLYGVQPMPQMDRRMYSYRDNSEMSSKTLWMGNVCCCRLIERKQIH